MNSVFNPTKKLLEKSNNAKINFLRKNITETPPLINQISNKINKKYDI